MFGVLASLGGGRATSEVRRELTTRLASKEARSSAAPLARSGYLTPHAHRLMRRVHRTRMHRHAVGLTKVRDTGPHGPVRLNAPPWTQPGARS